jgi:hypothetical protein
MYISNVQPTMNNYHYRCIVSESFSGCHNTSVECALTVPLGIDENQPLYFSLYPNPAKNELFLEMTDQIKEAEVMIFNSLGENVLNTEVRELKMKINIESFPNGFYFIELKSGNKISRQKFIKGS